MEETIVNEGVPPLGPRALIDAGARTNVEIRSALQILSQL